MAVVLLACGQLAWYRVLVVSQFMPHLANPTKWASCAADSSSATLELRCKVKAAQRSFKVGRGLLCETPPCLPLYEGAAWARLLPFQAPLQLAATHRSISVAVLVVPRPHRGRHCLSAQQLPLNCLPSALNSL